MASRAQVAKAGQSVNPALRWTLMASVVASVVSLVVGRTSEESISLPTIVPSSATEADRREAPSMPSELAIGALEAAEADPFALPLPAPPPPPVVTAAPPPAPAPTVPPLSYRYLGQFTDPQGKPKVYIANANKDVLIEVGTELDEGYRVVAITADEIQLVYPPLQQKASIQIPLAKTAP